MTRKQTGFIASVEATIRRFRMLAPGDTVLIAVSGGPDSVALLYALVAIRTDWSLHLHIAHLNHGIRKKEAPKEAAFVEELAGSLDIPCEIGFTDAERFSKKHGFSIQEGAREARYRFLQDVGTRRGVQKIAFGHHADDNAESVLMNLLRGTGPRGLMGIPPVRDNLFIRPLIEIPRNEIMSFLQQQRLPFKRDRSNLDSKYLRNRIRHELLPLLENRFSANCVATLNRLASILRVEETFWEPTVKNVLESQAIRLSDTEVVMNISELITLHPALSRRLIRDIIARLAGTLKRIRHDHVESVLSLAHNAQPSGILHLAQGVRVIREQDRLVFRMGEPPTIPPFEYRIEKPGTVFLPEIATELRFSTCSIGDMRGQVKTTPRTTALFDLKTIVFPIVIRNFRKGDRFVPLGMSGTQKIKDFFINEKVSRSKRMACPLLLNEGEIIWVGGHRISEHVKITEDTEKVLRADLISLALKETH